MTPMTAFQSHRASGDVVLMKVDTSRTLLPEFDDLAGDDVKYDNGSLCIVDLKSESLFSHIYNNEAQ